MSGSPTRKLRKIGEWGYLFVQIPSKMQYKYGLTANDLAVIEDNDGEIVIKIRKNHLGERVYGEKTYSTSKDVVQVVEP